MTQQEPWTEASTFDGNVINSVENERLNCLVGPIIETKYSIVYIQCNFGLFIYI